MYDGKLSYISKIGSHIKIKCVYFLNSNDSHPKVLDSWVCPFNYSLQAKETIIKAAVNLNINRVLDKPNVLGGKGANYSYSYSYEA